MAKRNMIAAVVGGAVSLALLAGACGNDDGDEPQPTSTNVPTSTTVATATSEPTFAIAPEPTATSTREPTATATEQPNGCPGDNASCEFAHQLDSWIKTGDVQSIIAVSTATEFECPDPMMQGAGGPYPVCEGAPEGDLRNGYQVARLQSEGAVIDADGLTQLLTDWLASVDTEKSDDFGAGDVQIVTFGCPSSESGEANCVGDFAVGFSAITTPSEAVTLRQVLVFGIDRSGANNTPRIRTVLWGGAGEVAGGFGAEFLEGGPSQFPVVLGADKPDAEFFAWSP